MPDELTCDCGTRASKGWAGLPEVPLDGDHWPLKFAAQALGMPLEDLKDLVRIVGLEPTGTAKMADFRRSGRQPRVYPAAALIKLHEAVYCLTEELTQMLLFHPRGISADVLRSIPTATTVHQRSGSSLLRRVI
jgi:hypothetical protein